MERIGMQKLALAMFGLGYCGLGFAGEASQAKRQKLSTSVFQQDLGGAVTAREKRIQGYLQEIIEDQQKELSSFFAVGQKVAADALAAQEAQHQQALKREQQKVEALRQENEALRVVAAKAEKAIVEGNLKKKKKGPAFLQRWVAKRKKSKRLAERREKLDKEDRQTAASKAAANRSAILNFVTPPSTLQRQSK